MKRVFIIVGSLALFTGLLMAGCRALISTIGNFNDCERFNIDNIEVRTGVDIPAITNVDCIYDNGIKNVTFTLDTVKVDIADYLEKNKFVKRDSLYTIVGDTKRTNWEVEYRNDRAALKMRIIYKDVKTDF
jgi:hypothetical protein